MALAPQQAQQQAAQNQFLAFLSWKKMNTRVARQNLADDECAWAENLVPIGANDWQTANAPNTPLTTSLGANAKRIWAAAFNSVDYLIVWQTNGNLSAVNTGTGAITFIVGGLTDPDITVWASQRILGVDPTGNYFSWDGTVFAHSGGLSPNIDVTAGGAGYTSAPAVAFSGGSGSGAAATAVILLGQVVAVNLTNPGNGYLPSDTVTVGFSGGGGTGAAASVRVWPTIAGNRLDVFAGRVWIANGRQLTFTGTGASQGGIGYDDVNPADASGTFSILDNDLSHTITAVRNLNNYLYIFGDKSVRQIGSITVSGGVTQFTPLTLASDIGTPFQMTIASYNRLVLFANVAGVYGIFGASVNKISDDLDGIFQLVDFTLPLCAGVVDVHPTLQDGGSLHCYALLVRYLDPLLFTRTLILLYKNDQWFIARQGDSLLALQGIFLASTNHFELFTSSGHDLTEAMALPGVAVQVLFRTALSSHKKPLTAKRLVRAGAAVTCSTAQNFTFTVETEYGTDIHQLNAASLITWVNNAGQQVFWQNNSSGLVSFVGGGYQFPYTQAYGEGKLIGATISGTIENFSLNTIAFEYVEGAIWGTVP